MFKKRKYATTDGQPSTFLYLDEWLFPEDRLLLPSNSNITRVEIDRKTCMEWASSSAERGYAWVCAETVGFPPLPTDVCPLYLHIDFTNLPFPESGSSLWDKIAYFTEEDASQTSFLRTGAAIVLENPRGGPSDGQAMSGDLRGIENIHLSKFVLKRFSLPIKSSPLPKMFRMIESGYGLTRGSRSEQFHLVSCPGVKNLDEQDVAKIVDAFHPEEEDEPTFDFHSRFRPSVHISKCDLSSLPGILGSPSAFRGRVDWHFTETELGSDWLHPDWLEKVKASTEQAPSSQGFSHMVGYPNWGHEPSGIRHMEDTSRIATAVVTVDRPIFRKESPQTEALYSVGGEIILSAAEHDIITRMKDSLGAMSLALLTGKAEEPPFLSW